MTFRNLGLTEPLLAAIEAMGYNSPTPIQEKSIPTVLMGRDVLGSAQTGTGKTASFTLPMIDILSSGQAKARLPRSLILTPTRELAAQVAESFDAFSKNHKLTKALLIGGVSFGEQDAALKKGADVLIATPGRLLDHVERGKVMLNDVKIFVIDEADRMLDMGFIPDVEKITALLPKLRQTLFYSATLDETIHKIAAQFVINPKIIEVAAPSAAASTVEQFIKKTTVREKRNALRQLISDENVANALIFCNRKRDISIVKSSLESHGLSVLEMHGDMSQSARNDALAQFKAGTVPLLVASDVAARGLDVAGLSHVFNFDVPNNAEDYVHRIGRTGRAGLSGRAFTLVATSDDAHCLEAIEKLIGKQIPQVEKNNKKPEAKKQEAPKQEQKKPKTPKQESPKQEQKNQPKQHANERPAPPDSNGDSFKNSGHIPAFLLS